MITVNPTTDKNIELANPLRYLDDISPTLLHAWEDDKLYILNLLKHIIDRGGCHI